MKTGLQIILLVGLAFARSAVAGEEPSEESAVCDVGPVLKVYGGNEWNVYSCTAPDQLVVVSAPGNPAMPFYFVFYMKDGERRLSGEGNGSKEASGAAYEELKIIADSEEEIAALIAETRKAHDQEN